VSVTFHDRKILFTFEINMIKPEKLILKILSGTADANIPFRELCQLMIRLGFDQRTSGSHHVFRKSGIPEKINLQEDDAKAKPYQIKQIRDLYRHGMSLRKNCDQGVYGITHTKQLCIRKPV